MRGRGFTVGLFAAAAISAGACGVANIGDPELGGGADAARALPSDAAPLPDARPPADAAIDAALACDQGDLQATDPETGGCYMLFETPASFADAEATCVGLGGHLAAVDGAAEQAIVGGLASQLDPLVPDAWLGGDDIAVGGTWRWIDDDSIFYQAGAPVLYTNFRAGEPNDNDPDCVPAGEDCLVIEGDRADLGYSWDDRCCTKLQPFVCQR